jgi:biopolymer transport protein ExbD
MNSIVEELLEEEPEINLTPMIDVVFLLLIFFMCMRFKEYENKLDSQLPTNEGLEDTPTEPIVTLRLELRLLPGSATKFTIRVNKPPFQTISWIGQDAGGGTEEVSPEMFNRLTDQVQNNFEYIGDKIELAPDLNMPFGYVALTIDAIHRGQKYFPGTTEERPDWDPNKKDHEQEDAKKRITFMAPPPER